MQKSDFGVNAAVAENSAKTAKDAIPQPTSDQAKVIQGINIILEGMQMILDGVAYPQSKLSEERGPEEVPEEDLRSLPVKPALAEKLAQAAATGQEAKTEGQVMEPGQAVETGKLEKSGQTDAPSITVGPDQPPVTKDTLTKVVVSKLKQDRSYSDRINKLVNSYGVTQLSDLPEDKYESFLRELTEM